MIPWYVFCCSTKFCEVYGFALPVNAKMFEDLSKIRKSKHEIDFPLELAVPDGFLEREWPFMWHLHAEVVDGEVRASRDLSRSLRDLSSVVRDISLEIVRVTRAQIQAFERELFREFVVQFLLCLPAGARRLTLYNLSFIILTLKARLTFTQNLDTDMVEYGKLSEMHYPVGKYEEVRARTRERSEFRAPRFHAESRDLMPSAAVFSQVQAWIMNPDACPTTWEEIKRIRAQHPNFSNGATALVIAPVDVD